MASEFQPIRQLSVVLWPRYARPAPNPFWGAMLPTAICTGFPVKSSSAHGRSLRAPQLSFSVSSSPEGSAFGGAGVGREGFARARTDPPANKKTANTLRRTGPPSPAFPRSVLCVCLALRGFPGFLGPSRFLGFFSALQMQACGHLLQVLAGLKLGFDLRDVRQFFSGLQKGFLHFVEMLDLMFNQAGDEPAMIVSALWRLGNLLNQLIFFLRDFPHTSKTQQSSSGRKVSVSGVRKLLEFFSRGVRWS